jgi:hypothetical protein
MSNDNNCLGNATKALEWVIGVEPNDPTEGPRYERVGERGCSAITLCEQYCGDHSLWFVQVEKNGEPDMMLSVERGVAEFGFQDT